MSIPASLRHDADLEIGSEPLPKCPECSCLSLITTESYPATLIDPACSAGYCACRESDIVSVCCGAPEHPDVEGFCGSCNEGTGFERACPCEYEWG